jgi:hypothetical protein
MSYQFSGDNSDDGDVSLNEQIVSVNDSFWYFGIDVAEWWSDWWRS